MCQCAAPREASGKSREPEIPTPVGVVRSACRSRVRMPTENRTALSKERHRDERLSVLPTCPMHQANSAPCRSATKPQRAGLPGLARDKTRTAAGRSAGLRSVADFAKSAGPPRGSSAPAWHFRDAMPERRGRRPRGYPRGHSAAPDPHPQNRSQSVRRNHSAVASAVRRNMQAVPGTMRDGATALPDALGATPRRSPPATHTRCGSPDRRYHRSRFGLRRSGSCRPRN